MSNMLALYRCCKCERRILVDTRGLMLARCECGAWHYERLAFIDTAEKTEEQVNAEVERQIQNGTEQ